MVDGKSEYYVLDFENPLGVDVIEIAAPSDKTNKFDKVQVSTRDIGIGLVTLKVINLDKSP